MLKLEEQGIIKLVHKDGSAFMHYLLNGDKLNSLTLADSTKVSDIKIENKAKVGFTMKPTEFYDVEISINQNKDEVKALFDKMLDLNFTHFKTYSEDLVILETKVNQ